MDGVKFFLVMLYSLFGGIIFYILYNRDCKLSLYFLKIVMILMFFEAYIIFSYDDVCSASKHLFCN